MIQIIADEKALMPERIQKWPDVTDNPPFFCQDQKRQEPNNPQPFCKSGVSGFLVIKNNQISLRPSLASAMASLSPASRIAR